MTEPTELTNKWADRMPETAADWLDHSVHGADREMRRDRDEFMADPVAHMTHCELLISEWTSAYLWATLIKHAPEVADKLATDVALACEAGDSFGEWLWQWRQELNAGQPITLPFEGEGMGL